MRGRGFCAGPLRDTHAALRPARSRGVTALVHTGHGPGSRHERHSGGRYVPSTLRREGLFDDDR